MVQTAGVKRYQRWEIGCRGWVGLGWIGLNWTRLDWTGLGWTGLERDSFYKYKESEMTID